jgi:UDP-N-acetylenolpyruvoylglucosamine reductase
VSLDERRRSGLQALDIGEVEFDVPMAPLTRLGIGGPADVVVRIDSVEALERLKRWCRRERLTVAPLPRGAGLLVRDGGLRGVVVATREGAEEGLEAAVAQLDVLATGLDLSDCTEGARIFLDPAGQRAADLIREAGLAGVRLRGARVSLERPNVVLNEGEASASDVLALVDYLKRKVQDQSGVKLQELLRVLGRDRA